MSSITLKKLLQRKNGPGSLLSELLASLDEPVGILDLDGGLLLGDAQGNGLPAGEPSPVLVEDQPVGWVVGGRGSQWQPRIASLLAFLFNQEAEKKALAAEVLDRYRELNLLYRLSEKLVASPQAQTIAIMALNEACPLLHVTSGIAVVKPEAEDGIETLAICGRPVQWKTGSALPGGIIGQVLQTGAAELANQIPASDYFADMDGPVVSMLCAPLKTEKRVFGAMILVSPETRQFTAGDLKLLNAIAMQAAPAIEIAHLHQFELENARLERDLQTARQVQSGLLPRIMPRLPGWWIAAYWQPARVVSGDFYDFIRFPDGRLGLVVADVSDKGMPAALVMANTRSILRAVAISAGEKGRESPGSILAQANDLLSEEMPINMFVTCLLMILDPISGQVCYANAGHNLPYQRTTRGVVELRATGLPLGLFPDIVYEDKLTYLDYGESILMYSDGLTEAHNAQGDMFETARLRQYLAYQPGAAPTPGEELISFLMDRLAEFTGPHWEQEDDVTLATLERLPPE